MRLIASPFPALETPGYCQTSLAGRAVMELRLFKTVKQIVTMFARLCPSFGAVHVVDHAIEAAGGAHI